ncbi:MAG: protein-L-isoaspartate(D-aspartate) O-methyltransferase [Deltaproteobacteria bacterium]|nr:protein-L-isoaspartate(D-aspartate) O-methyltransferase [Deltaproteobacteria bacterium]
MSLTLALMAAMTASDPFEVARSRMVDLIAARGVTDKRVLDALRRFPRHELVPERDRARAYEDGPLPIGHGQTISQPYMVAVMTEAAGVESGDKVLEVGTGSGYQAAILSLVGARVFTIEIVPELAARAGADLERLGIENVTVRAGDGYKGWPEQAPFDAIVVTAAPERVPPPLLAQLAEGGRLVIPVGPAGDQVLEVHERRGGAIQVSRSFAVRFVPMTGEAEKR